MIAEQAVHETGARHARRRVSLESGVDMRRLMAFLRWGGLTFCGVMALLWAASRYSYMTMTFVLGTNLLRCRVAAIDGLLIVDSQKIFVGDATRSRWFIPFWLLILVIGLPTALVFRLDRKRIPRGHCLKCGYNLTGNTSGVCPECGGDI